MLWQELGSIIRRWTLQFLFHLFFILRRFYTIFGNVSEVLETFLRNAQKIEKETFLETCPETLPHSLDAPPT